MARPSEYSEEIANQILELIASTDKGLHAICAMQEEFPHPVTFYRWINNNEELRNKYARAKEQQADVLAAQIIDIADDSRKDTEIRYTISGEAYEAPDTEWINRSRLRVDARKWLASKLAPKVYGDKIDVTSKDEKIESFNLGESIAKFMKPSENNPK